MCVITVSREFGSDGSVIAHDVAQALGYQFVDRQIIAKILSQYGFVEYMDDYDSAASFWDRFDARKTEMVSMLNRVIQALAHHNNIVLLGRGSFAVLEDYADVLNVRLQAPLAVRIQRVMESQNLPNVDATEDLVKENDKKRANFIESFYGPQWVTAKAFDLVVDTSKISPKIADQWIIEAAKAIDAQDKTGKRTTAAIEVDPVLARVVAEMFPG